MNDATPRKFKGSLLERAAEVYPFGLEPALRPVPERETVSEGPQEPEVRFVAETAEPLPLHREPEPVARDDEAADADMAEPWMEPAAEEDRPSLLSTIRGKIAMRFRRKQGGDEPHTNTMPDAAEEEFLEPLQAGGAVSRKRLARRGMLIPGGPVTVLAEEFRMIKRHLLTTSRAVSANDPEGARMVLVCSARPNDGKTFCAINLAISMAAEKDVEILLVDADFVQPGLMKALGLKDGPGLLDALADPTVDVEDCVVRTDIPQLSVLPAGTPRSTDTELLASERARTMLDGLAAANSRRIVIFDSPPALAASPASVLASHVGQVMLVVRADSTTESDLRETVQLLEACEHIQLVLNSVSFSPGGPRFGTYYGEEKAA
ncbi:AAA family ATPase [Stakelama marina]|uniref:AAA family ATPase n=1 Tax=Stakelama marina TaxID=2826939 RepID=A0A8T4IDK1_9SPHN|nr:AAA family ATPase [Stakelama marina]MBR0551934.1 AAA family ATPase [Stakelama marina]